MFFWKKKKKQVDTRPCFLRNAEEKCALIAPGGNGCPLTPFIYDEIYRFEAIDCSFYLCKVNGKTGLLEVDGTIAIPCEVDSIESQTGILVTRLGKKYGLYSGTGVYVQPILDEVKDKDSYVYVRMGERYGFIDDEEGYFLDEENEDTYDHGLMMFF